MYALVDCTNFYASCERLFRPALKYRPSMQVLNSSGASGLFRPALEYRPSMQVLNSSGTSGLFRPTLEYRPVVVSSNNDGCTPLPAVMGKDMVKMAVQGFERRYRLKAEHLSQQYTINMQEILKVKI